MSKERTNDSILQEEEIKQILKRWLRKNGWEPTAIAWGRKPGADIVAQQDKKEWVIEVKGCGSRNAMRVNYFLAILGETLQRMNNERTKYSIALPNMKQYRDLWDKLPALAKKRTKISVLFVEENGQVVEHEA